MKSNQASTYEKLILELPIAPKTWMVTGVAGFIGSNLLETLIKLNQRVVGIDNFSTGNKKNLDEVKSIVSSEQWSNFKFITCDIQNLVECRKACVGVDYVLHQAALGSVPRSIEDPISTNAVNITGFLNMMVASRDSGVKRFVYAASSSTYGDHPDLPKVEDKIGKPLSPYAVTKYVNELYAEVFSRTYELESIGLRYFNVFGPRQDPEGAYAAVIPKWITAMLNGDKIYINGDGEISRDFCYVSNVVQANILAAKTDNQDALNQVYNVANGERTSLNELFFQIQEKINNKTGKKEIIKPNYREYRVGDVLHSMASIDKGKTLLGYFPVQDFKSGLELSLEWYMKKQN